MSIKSQRYGEPRHPHRRFRTMDASELRQKAMHYRRVAGLVSDDGVAEALLELAAEYVSLADRTEETEPTPGAAQLSQQCPLDR